MSATSQTVDRAPASTDLVPASFRYSLGGFWALTARIVDLGLTGPDVATNGMHSRLAALGVPPNTRILDLPQVLDGLKQVTLRVRPDRTSCRHDLVGNFTGREARRILKEYLKPWGYTLNDDNNVVRSAG